MPAINALRRDSIDTAARFDADLYLISAASGRRLPDDFIISHCADQCSPRGYRYS